MNKDIKRRDEIVFGSYDPSRYNMGGCARTIVKAQVIKTLIKEDFIDPDDAQNYSPTAKEFMEIINGFEKYATFMVYAITDERDDYRVTIEGVDISMPDKMLNEYLNLGTYFRSADEFNMWKRGNKLNIHAWWD